MEKYIKEIKALITEDNKSKVLLVIFMVAFFWMESYAYYAMGYTEMQAYISGAVVAIVCRIVVNDLYEWYLGNRD